MSHRLDVLENYPQLSFWWQTERYIPAGYDSSPELARGKCAADLNFTSVVFFSSPLPGCRGVKQLAYRAPGIMQRWELHPTDTDSIVGTFKNSSWQSLCAATSFLILWLTAWNYLKFSPNFLEVYEK